MSDTGVRVVTTDAEREDAFAVRRAVFVDEQGVDEELEWDEHDEPDADATHFVAYGDGDVDETRSDSSANQTTSGDAVGAARLREAAPGVGKVERVVVSRDRRGEDWGRRVMEAVERTAREEGFEEVKLHAQTRVEGFYESLGYESVGEEFVEADIPHIEMRKSLSETQ